MLAGHPIARFYAPVRDIPASYLKEVLADPIANVLAVREPVGDVVALASLIRGQFSIAGDGEVLKVRVRLARQSRG